MPRPTRPPTEPPSPSFLDWSEKLPRLTALYKRTRMTDPQNYFARLVAHLPIPLVQETMELYDRGLEQLPADDFERLVKKSKDAASQPTPDRMYEHFFNLLDEVWGYLRFKSEGYSVHFVEAGKSDTPEACGHRPGEIALMEVKSLRESAEDLEAMSPTSKKRRARNGTLDLVKDSEPGGLFYRLEALVNEQAKRQLAYQSPCGTVTRRVFLVLVSDHRVLLSSENERILQKWARTKYAGRLDPEIRVEFWRTLAISLTGAPAEAAAVEDP